MQVENGEPPVLGYRDLVLLVIYFSDLSRSGPRKSSEMRIVKFDDIISAYLIVFRECQVAFCRSFYVSI